MLKKCLFIQWAPVGFDVFIYKIHMDILQNIFFCVPQKKVNQTGWVKLRLSKWQIFHFGWTIPLWNFTFACAQLSMSKVCALAAGPRLKQKMLFWQFLECNCIAETVISIPERSLSSHTTIPELPQLNKEMKTWQSERERWSEQRRGRSH